MGYKCSFMDNELYSAQDINDRFSSFLTSGVALADSGNLLADLNGISGELLSGGTAYDSCKVVSENGVYKITKGSCFMEDGSSIIFDDEGCELDVKPYLYNYVYLKRNAPQNTIDIMVTTNAPTGDFVPLAEITASGEILDRRKYAMLKVNSSQDGALKNYDCEFGYQESVKKQVNDVGTGNFSYIIVWSGEYGNKYGSTNLDSHEKCIRKITDGTDLKFTMLDARGYTRFTAVFRKNGNLLETSVTPVDSGYDCKLSFGVI